MWFFGKNKKQNDEHTEPKLVKLITVYNNYELGIIEGILKDNKIPYLVKEVGANSYMKIVTGAILNATDIMIEESQLEKAKELTDGIIDNQNDKK